ncbi:Pre-mRNA cleavage complex II protein Clp1-domain-containing protein [Epithele typhae]|uniref:Pre-mRNA cleavage complex II protein Clp1-domain-containing protein n=1 Tax=Epithele typhae TaxID=378194 RepID=UPI0020085B93|nr:Pre-mRNA cleavage complex II protein Clp1-domain-containing protein [Epithele typhae]KAH9928548.1 Pre-mRNA cleavage complex II protein Clp1-domain-containing protein [Epithele typhae]
MASGESGRPKQFELDQGASLAIKLVKGQAEIFGAEIADGKAYVFGQECKAAVYTWQGCTIEMSPSSRPCPPPHRRLRHSAARCLPAVFSQHVFGQPAVEYVSDETPMAPYANVHIALEQMRVRALDVANGTPAPPGEDNDPTGRGIRDPPRVLVLGPESAGKTSVCKTLVNYCVRAGQGWAPMYVNVDPSEGGWSIPGAISAAPITAPLQTSTPASPLGMSATSAPSHIASNALTPLSYWYGHREMRRNPLLMERLIRNLGDNIRDRQEGDTKGRCSGLIVDTPSSFAASSGPSNDHRLNMVKACVDAFQINLILVVGHEKLNVEMQRTYGKRLVVLKIPKSGGVVEHDSAYRERIHQYQLHNYFYGHIIDPPPGLPTKAFVQGGEQTPDLTLHLSPLSTSVNFGDVTMYRIGEETMAPQSALPIGATRVVSEMQPLLVDPAKSGSGLYNAVLAVLSSPNADESERYDEEVLDLQVVGYVVITALDLPNKRMTVLSPSPGSLTGKTAIVGSFEWQE